MKKFTPWSDLPLTLTVFQLGRYSILSNSANNYDYDEAGDYMCRLGHNLKESIKKMKTIVKDGGIKNLNYYIKDELDG